MRLNTPKRRLLLIRGLGHSGTTILDLALGAHSQITGLGEAVRLLEKPSPRDSHRGPAQLRGDLRHQRRCTCGQVAAQCPVWGPVLDWLPEHDDLELSVKLRRLLDALAESGAGASGDSPHWVVDSYQDDLQLQNLKAPDLEIRILHLTRDVRSWVHSRSRDGRRHGRWLPGLVPLLRWCRVNARQDRSLQRCGKPVLRIGYEQLALSPEQTLRRICEWLDIAWEGKMLVPIKHSSSHILSGNRMRFDAQKGSSIQYDYSWMQSPSGLAQFCLLIPWISRLNRRLVYPSAD